jgi:hypothetical protein
MSRDKSKGTVNNHTVMPSNFNELRKMFFRQNNARGSLNERYGSV